MEEEKEWNLPLLTCNPFRYSLWRKRRKEREEEEMKGKREVPIDLTDKIRDLSPIGWLLNVLWIKSMLVRKKEKEKRNKEKVEEKEWKEEREKGVKQKRGNEMYQDCLLIKNNRFVNDLLLPTLCFLYLLMKISLLPSSFSPCFSLNFFLFSLSFHTFLHSLIQSLIIILIIPINLGAESHLTQFFLLTLTDWMILHKFDTFDTLGQ